MFRFLNLQLIFEEACLAECDLLSSLSALMEYIGQPRVLVVGQRRPLNVIGKDL